MPLLIDCPKCKTEQWLEIDEYSDEHMVIVCPNCKASFRSDLKFMEVVE